MIGTTQHLRLSVPIDSRERIIRLAEKVRAKHDVRDLDEVARANSLILVRMAGVPGKEAGFAHVHYAREPKYIESLARPNERIRVWQDTRTIVRSIVINTNSGIPEAEVFWHEWYHLFHSPEGVQRSERFRHHYSTEGALHNQEERRADEFAAAVLIPDLSGCATIHDITERYSVSERLAKIAVRLYGVG